MAPVSIKGTRKTYSFEERKILISLINKYEDIEDRKSDPISMSKRKSAWSLLVEEYNSIVGPQSARSAVQLRRCWENMKACKRNREEKKTRNNSKSSSQLSKDFNQSSISSWENGNIYENHKPEVTPANGNGCLPPNVVFEPKDSEPFTLQSVSATKPTNICLKKEPETSGNESNADNTLNNISDIQDTIINKQTISMIQSQGIMSNDNHQELNNLSIMDHRSMDEEESIEPNHLAYKPDRTQAFVLSSPSGVNDSHVNHKTKVLQKEDELQLLALSEAQIKVDVAAMLKEEARIKLEEAVYRKEEARLRVLFFTYKLERIKED
ncbi:PREDICTED: myb/SANT-like DNA-binding domain-containing protein 3 [Polistes dominula]|uniref:Regulatory protein zeste n=1 Tax=Polistes dominula TaxID=743375 RepID=A0ABM1I1Q4_POLDO|nr:PREDICTED: myb/SANT-like DNA-binding domain-containing protein 3 [Polistes dominula]